MPPSCTTGELVNKRKLKLFTQHWKPEGTPEAVIFFVHGLGEYSNRYKKVFEQWAASGLAVHAYDHVGHGLSQDIPGRGRTNINEFRDLVDDAVLFIDSVKREQYPAGAPPPCFIVGHSLGGLVSAHVALRDQAAWEAGGLVLHSAAVDVEWTLVLRVQALFGTLLSALLPNAPLVPAEDMSRDPAHVKAYKEDPLIAHGNVKCRMGNETLHGFKELQRRYGEIKVPLLALHGTADKCTSYPAVKRLVAAASSAEKALVPMEGFYHEMFFEPGGDAVRLKIEEWVKERARVSRARL